MNPDKTSVECSYFGFDLTDDPSSNKFLFVDAAKN